MAHGTVTSEAIGPTLLKASIDQTASTSTACTKIESLPDRRCRCGLRVPRFPGVLSWSLCAFIHASSMALQSEVRKVQAVIGSDRPPANVVPCVSALPSLVDRNS